MSDNNLANLHELRRKAKLAGGGGSSKDGGMERRLADLEADMRELKATLGRVETFLRALDDRFRRTEADVAEVKGKVS